MHWCIYFDKRSILLGQKSSGVGICTEKLEEVRSIMSDDRANLTIVVRNVAPSREEGYPQIWMVDSAGESIRVAVALDDTSHPYVEGRFRVA